MRLERTYPIEYDVDGRRVAVLGASAPVRAKLFRLLAAGARPTVFLCGDAAGAVLERLARTGAVRIEAGRAPSPRRLARFVLVVAAPEHVSERVARWARRTGRLLCAVDRAEPSTFVSPAALEVGGIGVRFFSRGASPALVRRLREDLERGLSDPRLARFVERLTALRATLPRGARAARMRRAARGFRLEITLRFPRWLKR
jgi:precorrin-2 dehydrogenase/sirohydrochlorin ferrochelatase